MATAADGSSTDSGYADRLRRLSGLWWKRWLPNPYRWHIRRVAVGRVLDVGCGIGRGLQYLGGRGVGVDPNAAAVAIARARGLVAHAPDELLAEASHGQFDTLLCSHVLEHLDVDGARELLATWLPLIRRGGRVVLICPQARGFRSDPTHVTPFDAATLRFLCTELSVPVARTYSFPFPRRMGAWWRHNETVVIGSAP